MIIFFLINGFVIYIVHKAFSYDLYFIKNEDIFNNYQRIVDQKVLISLIVGVIAETAFAFGLLAKYIFNIKDN